MKQKVKQTTIHPVKRRKLAPTTKKATPPQLLTKIIINFNAGFPNNLFIRGEGGNLSWEQGIPLKNISPNQWVWETTSHFKSCYFKILINDKEFEAGDNNFLKAGTTTKFTPYFSNTPTL